MMRSDVRTKLQRQEQFLSEFRKRGNVTQACKASRIDRTLMYVWKREDKEFSNAYDQVKLEVCDALENAAYERAVDGVEKPVFQNGMRVGGIQEYSDTLLIFLLKGWMPEKYKDRVENTGNNQQSSILILPHNGRELEAMPAGVLRIGDAWQPSTTGRQTAAKAQEALMSTGKIDMPVRASEDEPSWQMADVRSTNIDPIGIDDLVF